MRSTPGTIRENSPENIPQADRSHDETHTDQYVHPDADTSVEQLDPTPTNPNAQNMIYVIIQRQIVMTTTDTKSHVCLSAHLRTTTYTIRVFWKSATERFRST